MTKYGKVRLYIEISNIINLWAPGGAHMLSTHHFWYVTAIVVYRKIATSHIIEMIIESVINVFNMQQ